MLWLSGMYHAGSIKRGLHLTGGIAWGHVLVLSSPFGEMNVPLTAGVRDSCDL